MFDQQASADMNMTPLIDILLVLLVLFVITIPAATHSLDIDLPAKCRECPLPDLNTDRNRLVLDRDDRLLWNGTPIDRRQLASLLDLARAQPVEPELQFAPEAFASYDAAARTVAIIKASGASRFGFVGNERYRDF